METTARDIYEFKACGDCLMLIANGDTTGNVRCDTEEGHAAYLAAVERETGSLHLVAASWPFGEVTIGDADEVEFDADGPFRVDEFGDVVQYDWTTEDKYYGRDTEGRFTYSGCEVCGSGLGGDKYPVVGWKA